MKRNPSIELWRCFCMFAIVVSHVLYNNKILGMSPFNWHVPGFLVITGFFGTSFKWKKVFQLLSVCYICYWVTIPIHGIKSAVDLLLPHGGWFVPFYVCLLIVCPIFNAALKDRTMHRQMFFAIIAILFFVWIPLFVPRLTMMRVIKQSGGMLLMIAPYMLGRLCAEYHAQERFKAWHLLTGAVVLEVMSIYLAKHFIGSIDYTAPITLALAFVGFSFFYQLKLPYWFERFICFISPSMFSVYVIHECCIRDWQCSGFAAQSSLNAVVWACGLFFVCIVIDMFRRIVFYLFTQIVRHIRHGDKGVGYAEQNSAERGVKGSVPSGGDRVVGAEEKA